jgi:transposase
VINGILWKLRTGTPWRDLPERYGPWQTVYDRFARWRRDGTWDRLLTRAQTKSYAVGEGCIGRLKHFRALATCYDKRAVKYRTFVILASLLLWLPHD